ncbi:MAG: hypothetical protein H6824_23935 [Planctomycetaceae bacterium]|nr:hypothetical protein [Planctomycetaceae bacterium]
MSRFLRLVLALAAAVLVSPRGSKALADDVNNADRDIAIAWSDFVYANVDGCATGTLKLSESVAGTDGLTKREYFIVFDRAQGLLRFDIKGPGLDSQCIVTPEQIIRAAPAIDGAGVTPIVSRLPPGSERVIIKGCRPFDVRHLGVHPALFSDLRIPFEDVVNSHLKLINESEIVVTQTPVLLQAESTRRDTQFGEKTVTWDYDPMQGGMLTRMTDVGAGGREEVEHRAWWEERSGVWVPVRTTYTDSQNGKVLKRIEYTMSWDAVNEPVDETLFTMESLDVPVGTGIYNHFRDPGGDGVLEGYVGGKRPAPPGLPRPVKLEPRNNWRLSWTALLFGFNILVASIFIMLIRWRKGESQDETVREGE